MNLSPTTLDIIKASLRADPLVSPADRATYITLLRNAGKPTPQAVKPTPTNGQRVLSRSQVAETLNRTTRSVDRMARQGILRRVTLPKHSRAAGFVASEVYALLNVEVAS